MIRRGILAVAVVALFLPAGCGASQPSSTFTASPSPSSTPYERAALISYIHAANQLSARINRIHLSLLNGPLSAFIDKRRPPRITAWTKLERWAASAHDAASEASVAASRLAPPSRLQAANTEFVAYFRDLAAAYEVLRKEAAARKGWNSQRPFVDFVTVFDHAGVKWLTGWQLPVQGETARLGLPDSATQTRY